MVLTTPREEVPLEPAPVSKGGTYSLESVRVGCKLYIRRPTADGEEERLAEILSIREKPTSTYALRRESDLDKDALAPADPADALEFFVHWNAFNKRLDGWVPGSRLVLARDMEWPRPKAQAPPKRLAGAALKAQQRVQNSQAMFAKGKGKGGKGKGKGPRKAPRGAAQQSLLKRASLNAANAVRAHTPGAASPTADYPFGGFPEDPAFDFLGSSLKRKREDEFDDDDAEGSIDPGSERDGEGSIVDPDPDDPMDDDPDGSDDDGEGELEDDEPHFDLASTEPGALPPPAPVAAFSKEAEIEKLRTSGSMTQSVSEVARVKNLNRLQIGAHEVDAWYFSPYPREYAHLPVLYLCEFCLSYFPSSFMLGRHRKRCTLLHPPGNEIYRHEDISFYELDGKRQLQYCRNLSLLSKCFLDHKTLYYDVTPFLYYVMCQRDSAGAHFIGYFSKEKESAEGYNVACILTLPQHQRYGFGKLLIEFSYELSKKEGRHGSPEKPLSDLGLLSYRAYWAEKILELLLQDYEKGEVETSVDDIAQRTSITHADVLNTCFTLQIFKYFKGQNVICLSDAVIERHKQAKARRKRRIKPDCLLWKPPIFTRDQLRFGW